MTGFVCSSDTVVFAFNGLAGTIMVLVLPLKVVGEEITFLLFNVGIVVLVVAGLAVFRKDEVFVFGFEGRGVYLLCSALVLPLRLAETASFM